MSAPLRRIALALAFATGLGACASGPAPRDRFFRLELPEPCASFAEPVYPGTLVVRRPRADALTSERNLLYRSGDSSEVGQQAYHYWSDHPTALVRETLARYLRESGVAGRVVTPELRVDPDYELSTRIVRLERILGSPPQVAVELEVGVTRTRDREVVLLGSYRETRPASGDGVAASVDATGEALAALIDRFLRDAAGDDPSRLEVADGCRSDAGRVGKREEPRWSS